MKKYECLFIFPPEVTGEARKDPSGEATKWIEKFQGKVIQKTDLGKRSIGYSIKKFKEGKVLVFDFEMDPARVQEFRKELELQEGLLKYTVTLPGKKAPLPVAAPAAAVSKA